MNDPKLYDFENIVGFTFSPAGLCANRLKIFAFVDNSNFALLLSNTIEYRFTMRSFCVYGSFHVIDDKLAALSKLRYENGVDDDELTCL